MLTKWIFASRTRLLPVFIALAVLAQDFAFGRILGNRQSIDPLLSELVEPLHQNGIDVVTGEVAKVPLGNRPRVVLLSTVSMQKPEHYVNGEWMQDFLAGKAGVIAGAQSDIPRANLSSEDEFRIVWEQTPQSKRIFISFARADIKVAQQIKAVLESKGYAAFTFLNPQTGSPKYDASFSGRIFSQAGLILLSIRRAPERVRECILKRHY
jgi:hypothetical protein